MPGSGAFIRNTTLFTIATEGYVPFVLNLMASMRASGLDPRSLVVYALHDDAERRLRGAGVCLTQIRRHDVEGVTDWRDFRSEGFSRVTSAKFAIGAALLKSGTNLVFVDGDIVFRRDPTEYLRRVVDGARTDMVMQYESPKNEYNTGFWHARGSGGVIDLFEQIERALLVGDFYKDDQTCFNRLLPTAGTVRVQPLDVRLFACGNQFLDNPAVAEEAYLLHFNYVPGRYEKLRFMEQFGAVVHESLARELRRAKTFRALKAVPLLTFRALKAVPLLTWRLRQLLTPLVGERRLTPRVAPSLERLTRRQPLSAQESDLEVEADRK